MSDPSPSASESLFSFSSSPLEARFFLRFAFLLSRECAFRSVVVLWIRSLCSLEVSYSGLDLQGLLELGPRERYFLELRY